MAYKEKKKVLSALRHLPTTALEHEFVVLVLETLCVHGT